MYKHLTSGACFALLLTFCIFITVKDNIFVALDDYAYIVNNPNISQLDLNTIVWSFTTVFEGNWHPLTMLSLALDRYIWGLNPFGFHLTNILFHSCSVFFSCYLFACLLRAANSEHVTDRAIVIGSIAAALFFGVHPLRVESVVWASERKDVLCMFFIILSLLMYLRYAVKRTFADKVSFWHVHAYYYSLLLAALALLSKPTAVSLPLLLVIIDWYPLKRISDKSSFVCSLVEKIPFIILCTIGAGSTFFAQQIAMKYAPDVGLISRILVACRALLYYLVKTIWPSELTAFYIHPGNVVSFALIQYLIYLLIVLLITAVAVWSVSRYRWWTAFWLFYVITLLPMIGLIQVGGQWAADRYSYLPSLGIALLWGGAVAHLYDTARNTSYRIAAWFCIVLAAFQLILYSELTLRQIPVWSNTETLATKIINKEPHTTGAPYLARAIYRSEIGKNEQALEDIGDAMKIALRKGLIRTYPETAFVQAVILKKLGRYKEALTIMDWGIEMCVEPPPFDALALRTELARLAK